jgi:hypothetical protein
MLSNNMDYGVYYTLTYENENATVRVKGLWGGSNHAMKIFNKLNQWSLILQ